MSGGSLAPASRLLTSFPSVFSDAGLCGQCGMNTAIKMKNNSENVLLWGLFGMVAGIFVGSLLVVFILNPLFPSKEPANNNLTEAHSGKGDHGCVHRRTKDTMNADLLRNGLDILSNRRDWETRQRTYYLMRHDGLRRRNKPFPTAADLHLALVDEKVNQKKAFTLAQVMGAPHLAHLTSYRQQLQETTDSAIAYFDFELKHRTNLLDVLDGCFDTMWLRGRGIIKAYVDPFNDYRIVHENVDPLYLLMPDTANDFRGRRRMDSRQANQRGEVQARPAILQPHDEQQGHAGQ